MNMRKLMTITAILLWITAAFEAQAQAGFGKASLFNDDWLFVLEDVRDGASADCADSSWEKIGLPHDWSVLQHASPTLASCTGYYPGGIAWYRKHFTIDDLSKKYYIYFEGVYNRSEVYLNGQKLGYRPNGYVSFMYDLTPYLNEGENVLAVRVDHSRYADSRWYTGSGIYRDVYLVEAPHQHFSQWGATYSLRTLDSSKAVLDVTYSVDGKGEGRQEVGIVLYDAEGNAVAKAKGKDGKAALNVRSPKLWGIENPYLYRMELTLKSNGKVIDETGFNVGIRTVKFDPDKGFSLNGESMKIKGVCIHHDAGTLGAAVPADVWERRLRNLKDMGANAIRTSHNPQAPVVYDICDRIGLMVMDEISDEWEFPKRKWITGWNHGTPGFDGTYDFFEEWIERDAQDMVLRDRNHPSIILWSIGNEVDYPNDPYSHPVLDKEGIAQHNFGGYDPEAPHADRIGKIAQRIAACVRAVDSSRHITGALAGVVMANETEYPDAVDVVGYNYTEHRYDQDHAKYPERVIYGSENGVGYQQWKAVLDREFIAGQFIWTGMDYLGESRSWPSRGLNTGLLDFGGFRKPRGWFRAALWSESPVTYIGTYPDYRRPSGGRMRLSAEASDLWNYEDGQMINVVCYTNAPYARLILNGKTVGETKPYDHETGIIHWQIPFASGKLTAEGCDAEGNVLSSYDIVTVGRPYELHAEVDKQTLEGDRAVAHIVLTVRDEDGNLVTLADNNITCRINGPAELLGLEGSDNRDMGDYTDNVQRVYKGRLLAYVKAAGEGTAEITFTSPLLKGVTVKIDCK